MTGWGGCPPPGHCEMPRFGKLSSGRMNALGEPMVLPGFTPTSPWNGECPAGENASLGSCAMRAFVECVTSANATAGNPCLPRMMTSSNANSLPMRLTGCGFVTSPNIEHVTAGCVALLSPTPTHAWSSAGLSMTICGQNSSSMPSKWQGGSGNQCLGPLFTRTGERNTRPEFLVTASGRQDCSDRWGKSLPVSITRSSNRSGRRCNRNYSSGSPGPAESSLPVQCFEWIEG